MADKAPRLINADVFLEALKKQKAVWKNGISETHLGDIAKEKIKSYDMAIELLESQPTVPGWDECLAEVREQLQDSMLNLTFHKDSNSKSFNGGIGVAIDIVDRLRQKYRDRDVKLTPEQAAELLDVWIHEDIDD